MSAGGIRIVSWNILQGGGRRVSEVAAHLAGLAPDIVTLQEYRNGTSEPIADALRAAGLRHQFVADADAGANTIFIAARERFDAGDFMPGPDADPDGEDDDDDDGGGGNGHLFEAAFEQGLVLLAAHFPQKDAQKPLFAQLIADTSSLLEADALLIGDLNCGIPFEDSDSKTFANTALFRQLLLQGWRDAWRSRHPQAREFSWTSPRTGNRFRYDHALASASLDARVRAVRYDHAGREERLSDHSAIVVELD